MDVMEEEIERKKNIIEAALYDMQVKRVHIKEWHEDTKKLIEELKELEEEEEVEEPEWKEYMKKFKNIQKKEKKRALQKKKQMQKRKKEGGD